VTVPLEEAVYHPADIFVWQLSIKGLPIPAITCPNIAK
jgi:hypothetical protein